MPSFHPTATCKKHFDSGLLQECAIKEEKFSKRARFMGERGTALGSGGFAPHPLTSFCSFEAISQRLVMAVSIYIRPYIDYDIIYMD